MNTVVKNILKRKKMKKIVSMAMVVAAVAFSACSNDISPIDNDGKTGMVLNATVAGQDESTRATMSGDGEGTGNWTFAFDGGDKVAVGNSAVSGYYTFVKGADHFVSTDAKATATDADWCAYFPDNEMSFADQDGSFAKVANSYALAGKTDAATTGADGLNITMKAQVAVLRVVKVEKAKFGACDINVRTADGKYISGLKARKGEATFDVTTSDSKVTFLSKTEPGVYYITVPTGIKISIYNGDNLRNTTKDAGLTAGKYYTITTAPTTGTEEATINGKTVQIGWVQLYPGGAKIATQNVGTQLSWTEAAKTGDDYVWGKNWRTPTTDEMNIVNGEKIGKACDVENGKPGFVFYGIHIGYSKTKNRIFLPAKNTDVKWLEGSYWSSVADGTDKGKCLDLIGSNGTFGYGDWSSLPIISNNKETVNDVRPIINE